MWNIENNLKVFKNGQEAYAEVASIASSCPDFTADYEEEWADDEEISCYNCKFRRWTTKSFMCMYK